MKINIVKSFFFLLFFAFLVGCSTKKDTFLARNSHALSTKYNILYNGQVGFDKGLKTLKTSNEDNFWELLPIEKMQILEEFSEASKPKNADFELAETKATKAIQKHSMNIGGSEKNSQIDEAYLLLGKARYYDQRFVPALDAFNYILYKYPNSSKIYEAKIWREKTNMRLGNDALVIKNISKLLKDHEVKKQVFADANALLSASFLNLEEKDSAVAKLKLAIAFTKVNPEKARYRFVLGQLYQQLGHKDSAVFCYQDVIDMNRKAERKFVMQAHAKKAALFDYQNGDKIAFQETFDKLIKDRENRPYKDLILHQMAVFHDKQNNQETATKFYNESLKANSNDSYLVASNYRNLGNMNFRNAAYAKAASYYDSTLVKLNPKTREFAKIKKIRSNLDEVIQYETIAQRNDSILKAVAMTPEDRKAYYEKYITVLKEKDELKRLLDKKNKELQENRERNNSINSPDPIANNNTPIAGTRLTMTPPSANSSTAPQSNAVFYFYNPTTVAFGKVEFKKNWGNRASNGNWRVSGTPNSGIAISNEDTVNNATTPEIKEVVVEYTSDFYTNQLPTKQTELDSIAKERNFAYYQLGIVYKEKFKENTLAIAKLEQLLRNNPEEKLVLPTMYNLYKLYQITDTNKALEMKKKIGEQFPTSRYAQIINNGNIDKNALNETPESVYNKWYQAFREEQFVTVLENADNLITQYSGDEVVSKFELLKANTIGKLRGVTAYKNALQDVADNYPNSEEGKNAASTLKEQIPILEKMDFIPMDTNNWKILYPVGKKNDADTKALEDKLVKIFKENKFQELTFSYDFYNEKQSFITIHGLNSAEFANGVIAKIKANTAPETKQTPVVVTNLNYKVIQIKKNLDAYLAIKK